MALMGSDQAKLEQNDQTRAVLEWLRTEGAQNLLKQVAAGRAQRADEPDIQRGQEEVQRRRDTAVHDWLKTPEAQRFLMGREDADIAMRQQGGRGPGSGVGPQPQPPGSVGFTPQGPAGASGRVPGGFGINEPASHSSRIPGGFGINPRDQMLEALMAAGGRNPDFTRGGNAYTAQIAQQYGLPLSGGDATFAGPGGMQGNAFRAFMGADPASRDYTGHGSMWRHQAAPRPSYQGSGYGPPGAGSPGGPPGGPGAYLPQPSGDPRFGPRR